SRSVSGQGWFADPDRRAIGEDRRLGLAAVDADPVGGAEVVNAHVRIAAVVVDPDLGVAPRDAGVGDPQVGVVASADDDAGRQQRVALAVDLDRRRGPSYL